MTPRFVLFEHICQVESVTIIPECNTDQSKGFVFGDLGDKDAEQVIAQSNGTEVGGRSLTVNAAHPRGPAHMTQDIYGKKFFPTPLK